MVPEREYVVTISKVTLQLPRGISVSWGLRTISGRGAERGVKLTTGGRSADRERLETPPQRSYRQQSTGEKSPWAMQIT